MRQNILDETSRVLKQKYLNNRQALEKKADVLRQKNDEMFSQFMATQAARLLTNKLLQRQQQQEIQTSNPEPYIDFDISLETDEDTKNLSLKVEINEPSFSEDDCYSDLPDSDMSILRGNGASLFL
ncbi:hypothetical protein [Lactiplantibacillus pentosus]|uniref:hypothetical protein n=1 Tax=Lactiplantibacillus pentosus TaxID=1589 RepID=UPI001C1F4252|nr:hypothetical protein [Lactiplantibacillus pentosus]MBU7491866.1 hypothetical protein [Lactiplantibacillus pentosus]